MNGLLGEGSTGKLSECHNQISILIVEMVDVSFRQKTLAEEEPLIIPQVLRVELIFNSATHTCEVND